MNGSDSESQIYESGTQTDAREIDALGFILWGEGTATVGDKTYFLSRGDTNYTETNLVQWNSSDCSADFIKIADINPFSFTHSDQGFFVASVLNGEAILRTYDQAGTELKTAKHSDWIFTKVLVDGDRVYVFGMSVEKGETSPKGELWVFDATTLGVVDRIPLPDGSQVDSAAIYKTGIVYPEAYNATTNQPTNRLIFLDPRTKKIEPLELSSKLPALLRVAGNKAYIAHTYINPSFGSLLDMRTITVVDLDTRKEVDTLTTDIGISQIEIHNDVLYVEGQAIEGQPRVDEYALKDLSKIRSYPLNKPQTDEFRYPAGFFINSVES